MPPNGSAALAPMTLRVHVLPPSNDTASRSPATTSGRVAMVTMLFGFVGLIAMAPFADRAVYRGAAVGADDPAGRFGAPANARSGAGNEGIPPTRTVPRCV